MLRSLLLMTLASLAAASPLSVEQSRFSAPSNSTDSKVNVTLYVMSRCPDARLCESVFEDVFQAKGMTSKVNLNMGYIAQKNESAPLGLECKHGTAECLGNAHQLCLQNHLSLPDFYAVLSCMNYQTPFPSDIGKVSLVRRCAQAVGVNWKDSGVSRCIEGHEGKREGLAKEGYELLRDNVEQTLEANVSRSCTIRIDSTIAKGGYRSCVVDGGVWTGCDDGHAPSDFVRVIEEEWKKLQK